MSDRLSPQPMSPPPRRGERRLGQRPEDGRRRNREAVMGLLRGRAQGRADLARGLGLSKTALGDLIAGLVAEGLVEERGEGERPAAGRGRRPAPLHIRAGAAAVLGVDLSVTAFEFGVYDLLGRPLHRHRLTPEPGEGQPGVYARLRRGVREARGQAGEMGLPVAAVGVAAPGPLDADSGVILAPPTFPELRGLEVASRLTADLGLPVRLERDTTAAATAHLRAHDAGNFVYLLLMERGIGAGLVMGGAVYRGTHGYAGEFGHLSLDVDGPPCPCGNRGCLERVADVWATERAYAGRAGQALPLAAIVERAQGGEGAAREVLDAAGRALGRAAVGLVNLLDPQALVLGGVGARAAPFLLPALRRELGARAYPYLRWGEHLDLRVCDLPHPTLQGAAECALNAVYRGDLPPSPTTRVPAPV